MQIEPECAEAQEDEGRGEGEQELRSRRRRSRRRRGGRRRHRLRRLLLEDNLASLLRAWLQELFQRLDRVGKDLGERHRGATGTSGRRRRSWRRQGREGRSLHCVGADDARPRKSSRSGLFPFLLLLLLRLPGEKDRGRQRRREAAAAPEEGRLLLFGAHVRLLFFVRGERREKREEMKAKRPSLEEEVRSSFVASFFTSKKGKKTEAPYFAPPLLARTASSSFGSASLQSPTSP